MGGPEIVILMILLAVCALIAYALRLRYERRAFQHKERLAALEKGAQLPDLVEDGRWPSASPRIYLLRGMMWLFSGIALVIFLLGATAASQQPETIENRLYRAQNLKGLDATPDQIQKVIDDPTPVHRAPEAIALLGLVPIGVGLAYLIFYRVETRRPLPES